MSYFISPTLPHDLPESWTEDQYIAPDGASVGLTEKHGYNYLCRQVNNAQQAALDLAYAVSSGFDNLLDNWHLAYALNTAGGYYAPKGTTYYSDDTVKTSAGTLSESTAVTYVNSTYCTVLVGTAMYYVKTSAAYQGYVRESVSGFTFDRWWAKSCTVELDKSNKGVRIQCTNSYVNGVFRQVVIHGAQMSSRQVTLSLYAEAVSGACTMKMYTGATPDALSTVQVGSPVTLKQGLNSATYFMSSNIGVDKGAYLFAVVELPPNSSITIQAMKLQLGPAQTLGYVQDNGYWRLTTVPHPIIERMKCYFAPAEVGGQGLTLGTAASTLADATIE